MGILCGWLPSGPIVPRKLRRGDIIRVVAPARSRKFVTVHDHNVLIEKRFAALGLRLTFGDRVDECDDFDSSSVVSRVADLHAAFADPEVAGILTVIGGFNSNELLPHLDWDLIAAHPKVFCGYSDITAVQNVILARTGLLTYSGPHWSSFGMRDHFEQTEQWFTQALLGKGPIEVRPSETWTDDLWFVDQDKRTVRANDGWWAPHGWAGDRSHCRGEPVHPESPAGNPVHAVFGRDGPHGRGRLSLRRHRVRSEPNVPAATP